MKTMGSLVRLLCVLMLLTPTAASAAPPYHSDADRPNILFIIADDQRWDTIGALGNSEISTPNLDSLAKRGFVFRNAYCMGSMIGAVCTPSRTMLLTGRSLWRIPPWDTKTWTEPTLGSIYKDAGYDTLFVGKRGNSFVAAHEEFETVVYDEQRTDAKDRAGSSEFHANTTINWLKSRDGKRPFLVYFAPPVPHDPRVAPPEFMKMYSAEKITLSKNFRPQHPFDNGELHVRDELLASHPRSEADMKRHLADYYATVSCLDHHIGQVLSALRESGQLDNTLVIFTSDQGLAVGGRHGLMGKQNLYEHVKPPLILAGPGIPPGSSDALVYLFDLLPTLCEYSSLPTPQQAEGKSLLPVAQGRKTKVRDWLFGAYRDCQRMIRDERWKLIAYNAGGERNIQLFDLAHDPDEITNLADDPTHAQHRARLEKLLVDARKQFRDPVEFEIAKQQMSNLGSNVAHYGAPRRNGKDQSDLCRHQIGWGWENRPHGPTLASDVLGQFVDGNPALPNFGAYGPYGGPKPHAFFFFAFNAGRYQVVGGMAAHTGIGKLAVPDYWNHRVLLFDLRPDGSLAERRASALIGQERFDMMEIGQGPDRFQFPSSCAFDPAGKFLFVADEYNHRILQFNMNDPRRAVRVYGQRDFSAWGIDSSPGELIWDSTREDVRGPKLVRKPNARGLFLPRAVASDGNRLFVADCDNHRVIIFDQRGGENGPEAIAVLGQADFSGYTPNRGGKPDAQSMCFPLGLAIDPSGRYLLVADSLNFRWLIFDVSKPIENGMPAVAVVTLPGIKPSDLPNPPFERNIAGATAIAVSKTGDVYVADRAALRVVVYRLDDVLANKLEPRAAIGRFEMSTDLWQMKPGYGGPTGLAVAGQRLYVAEPRGNRVLCYDAKNPEQRAVDLLGQSYGNDLTRPHFNKYGPNNGPDPYGFDFADGVPALSVTDDGNWLLVSDPIGGRLLFFPLGEDGLALDRSARLAIGVPTLDARANSYGAARFNRPGHTLLTSDGRLFAADFQGSRILYFELPNLINTTSRGALGPLRPFTPSPDRQPVPREDFEFRSVNSGGTALHVLGQVDFYTGLRDTASPRQMGKETSGLAFDRDRGWLFVCEKLNHRVLIADVGRGVETYMPAFAVLGQPDFEKNSPQWGHKEWHPQGMTLPAGVCYDHATKTLFVVSGDQEREILGFDLSGEITNGMAPVLRIGGPHATVDSDLPVVERWLALDERNRRLWSGLFALDLRGEIRKKVPLAGWFGLGDHPEAAREQDTHTGDVPSLLGYSVGFCHRFGGAVNALAVNPRTGTVYTADSPRYRVLCYQPEFRFCSTELQLNVGAPVCEIIGTGGLAPLRFSLTAGRLPAGLELDSENGLIRGTPRDKSGSYDVEIAAKTATGTSRGKLNILLMSGR